MKEDLAQKLRMESDLESICCLKDFEKESERPKFVFEVWNDWRHRCLDENSEMFLSLLTNEERTLIPALEMAYSCGRFEERAYYS